MTDPSQSGPSPSSPPDWAIERGVISSEHFAPVSETLIHEGTVISLFNATIEDGEKNQFDRDLVRHPGAVAVVPIDGSDILLVQQYRASLNGDLIEIPAGKRDVADEPPIETAYRELEEEVGMKAGSMELLLNVHHSPGFCDEYGHIFLATDLQPVPQRREGPEEQVMVVHRTSLAEAVEMCLSGRITDAKSVCGILAAARQLGVD
jgi:ADP-ribose pyrophosphatase